MNPSVLKEAGKHLARVIGPASSISHGIMGPMGQRLSLRFACLSGKPNQPSKSSKHTSVRGMDLLRDPTTNKSMAFSLKERQILGIHGLLPPAIIDQDQQAFRVMSNINRWDNNLDKHIYMMQLLDRNEKLFYKVVSENVDIMTPLIYTPTVGLACQKYGLIYRKPKGLFITINDAGHVYNIIENWPEHDVKAVVVTDGERILGLGDLGAYGMGIPVGKLALYTALGGIHPTKCLPVLLDVGTDNEKLLNDPLYIGVKHKRLRGKAYDDFIEEFLEAIIKRYGNDTLIQFEDFANKNAFRLLDKYRDQFCTFNDDIQGTACVAVAGLITSVKVTNTRLIDNKFLFQGAGEASIGIANLLVMAMEQEGVSTEEARSRIWMVDSGGLLVKGRKDLTGHKLHFAKEADPNRSLEQIVHDVKPTALIGAAAVSGAFNETILKDMASFNERPIIFALSNPTSKAECTAEQAYTHTDGRCVFASGSPFDAVTYNGQTFYPGQGNNAYIFPGVALGVICGGIRHIGEEIFLISAKALSEMVTEEHLAEGRVYPPLDSVREVSVKLATAIVEHAYQEGMAAFYPEPEDKESFIRSQLYDYNYDSFLPQVYDWPGSEHN